MEIALIKNGQLQKIEILNIIIISLTTLYKKDDEILNVEK